MYSGVCVNISCNSCLALHSPFFFSSTVSNSNVCWIETIVRFCILPISFSLLSTQFGWKWRRPRHIWQWKSRHELITLFIQRKTNTRLFSVSKLNVKFKMGSELRFRCVYRVVLLDNLSFNKQKWKVIVFACGSVWECMPIVPWFWCSELFHYLYNKWHSYRAIHLR